MRALSFLVCWLILAPMACNEVKNNDVKNDPGPAELDLTKPGIICELHHVPLQEGKVRIRYGLGPENKRDHRDDMKWFPNANSVHLGGCVITESSPKWARVSFCPECRKAEAKWREAEERKMVPVRALWQQVRELIQANPKFQGVHHYVRPGASLNVGLEGHVKSDADLAELRRVFEAAKLPQPVEWSVDIIP